MNLVLVGLELVFLLVASVSSGELSKWFQASRGIRQGDLLSPHIFIMVSQNLSAPMNFAMNQNYIPGFDNCLSSNFNHLLFADDLIAITKASINVARKCMLCFNIYSSLIGQCPNPNKSGISFPSGPTGEWPLLSRISWV